MDIERLSYMANQIARNFAAQGEQAAIAATAQHIRDFWDRRMIIALAEAGGEGLDAVARAAFEQV
jgi:formate dehydrogenase subunit delta